EDPDPHLRVAGLRREHEHRLRERHLLRECLHRGRVEVARVGEDGELVAGQRRVGEDVGDDVAEAAHGATVVGWPAGPPGRWHYAVGVGLILVRHAEAEPGSPDELRQLTRAGAAAARELGARLAGERPDAVVSSPLVRAVATAAAIADAAGLT